MLASGLIQRLGGHIEAVFWPDDGPALDPNLGETGWVAQRLKHTSPLLVAERDIARGPVFKQESHTVVADHG